MMNFLVGANRRISFLGIVFVLILVFNQAKGQVSRIDVDEASDIEYNVCSENQFSIFVFRHPEIGPLEGRYSSLLDQVATQTSIYMVDIRMEPIPGCSRPKLFDLCGYTTLNPYMKYKPFLGFISTASNRWTAFQSSPYYAMNKSFFLPVTDKEGNRAPFVNINSFEGFDIILDYINSRPFRSYSQNAEPPKAIKSETPSVDSAMVSKWITALFESRKPVVKPVSGYLGFKVSGLYGEMNSVGTTSPDVTTAETSSITGQGFALFYERPLMLPAQSIKLRQRLEVGSQQISFSSQITSDYGPSPKVFSVTNLCGSYLGLTDFFLASNTNLTIGGGVSLLGRLGYHSSQSTNMNPIRSNNQIPDNDQRRSDKINSFDFGFIVNGGLRHTFSSNLCAFLDLGYNMGLLNFEKEETKESGDNYKINLFNVSAGFMFPIR